MDQLHKDLKQNDLPNDLTQQLDVVLENILHDPLSTYPCADLPVLQNIQAKLPTAFSEFTSKTDQLLLILAFSKAILSDCIQICGGNDLRLRLFHSDTLQLALNRVYQIPFKLESSNDAKAFSPHQPPVSIISINGQASSNFLTIKTSSSETSFQVDTFRLLLKHQLTGEQQETTFTVPIQLH